MMEIDQLVELAQRRRSVRRFKPDPIPEEYIRKILEVARWAMSGANGQPWEFIVVKDETTKKKIAELKTEPSELAAAMESSRTPEMRKHFSHRITKNILEFDFQDAPVLIFTCADPRTAQATVLDRLCDRRWVIDENIANATQMIHLAVAACGLGSQWVTVSRYFEELIKPVLGIPPIIRIMNLIPVGYPAYKPRTPYRRELNDIIHNEKYDMSKYRSHLEVQEFICKLRNITKPFYALE